MGLRPTKGDENRFVRTWRTHSCVPRRHSCRRKVGQAVAPVIP